MTEARKVEITWTSKNNSFKHEPGEITVSSLEDLEALCVKYDTDIILGIDPETGKLSTVEVYDDYRE